MPGDIIDSFLHVADLHFWRVVTNPLRLLNKRFLGNLNVLLRRRHEFVMEWARPHSDVLAAAGIRFVLLTGDFTSTALDEEFALARSFVDGLRARGLRIALMPGNHDVYTFGAHRSKRFERHFAEYLPADGYPCRLTLPGGTPLVLAPTVCPNVLSSRGRVAEDAAARVAELLEECAGRVVVAGHYPLLTDTPGYHTTWSRRLRNAQALHEALGASGRRILYVCGHVHRFSYDRDRRYPTLEHLSTGAFLCNDTHRGTQGEFAEVRVSPDAFHVIRHVNRNGWKQEQATP